MDELFCPLRMYHGQSVRLDVGSGFNLGGGDGQRDGSKTKMVSRHQEGPGALDEVALRGQR